jgi:peptidyl-prolyl cis-trans isomerase A (cyclophilin A)
VTLALLALPILSSGADIALAQTDAECTRTISTDVTLQLAIDIAMPGDVICLESGFWDENILIDKSLEIRGIGSVRIRGAEPDFPAVTLINRSPTGSHLEIELRNLGIWRVPNSCDQFSCSTGVALDGAVSGKLLGVQVFGHGTSGVVIQEDAHLEFESSTIIGSGRSGLAMHGDSSASIHKSTFSENGQDDRCLISVVVCNGVELFDASQIEISESAFALNADWGLAAAVKQCGYATDDFSGHIQFEGLNDFFRNGSTGNQDELGNPGLHGRVDLDAGQLCTQEIFITNVEARTSNELIELQNVSSQDFDVSLWTLNVGGNETENRFEFPLGCIFRAGTILKINSGPGSREILDTGCDSDDGNLIWTDSFSIPDESAEITLLDTSGIVIAKFGLQSSRPIVVVETNLGAFKMMLYLDLTPITSGNFIDLVESGFYDGLVFHRIIEGFVIQGGDPECTNGGRCGTGGSEMTIPLEIAPELTQDRAGIVAMARAQDPDSASSQFYITLSPQTRLDGSYAIFGEVIEGLELVLEMGSVGTDSQDRPLEDVVMERVFVEN